MNVSRLVILLSACALLGFGANAAPATGIAKKYPGDKGIGSDPRVIFADDFESGSLDQIAKRWSELSNKDGKVVSFSADVPEGSGGKRAIQMTSTFGENTGGHLYTKFKEGVETAYARFYVKFTSKDAYIHHFVTMGGYDPPTNWPQGGAGERPAGGDRFTIGIEPYGGHGKYSAPGAWNFYAYWSEMKVSAGGKYWGNSITPVEPAIIPLQKWQCVEFMVKCNTIGKRDGELALWIDGEKIMRIAPGVARGQWTGMGFPLVEKDGEPFEGFMWRTDPNLKINFFWLMHYVTENAARQNRFLNPNPVNTVLFDNVVVATEYIGPVKPAQREK